MSQANIDLIKNLYAAFEKRDVVAIFTALASDVEISQSPEVPWGGVYRGPDGFREFLTKLTRHVHSQVTVERYIDAGEDVVVIGRTAGKVVANGNAFDVPAAHIWRIRDGKVRCFYPFIDLPTMQKALK